MVLDPIILSIFMFGFQKVVAKPTAQENDSGNFGMDFNQSMPFNQMVFQCLNLGLLNILEIPLNIATSVLKATNDTTPLLIEVS